jgi:hypothetical protein
MTDRLFAFIKHDFVLCYSVVLYEITGDIFAVISTHCKEIIQLTSICISISGIQLSPISLKIRSATLVIF